MVKTFFTTLASGMLVILFCANSKAQGINYEAFDGNIFKNENHKHTPLSDSLRKQMKQLRKQLDSLSRELETIELPDINSYDLQWTPPHFHVPKLNIKPSPFRFETPEKEFDLPPDILIPQGPGEYFQDIPEEDLRNMLPPNFEIPDLRNPNDPYFKYPPQEMPRMPNFRGPKLRKHTPSKPLPDFPRWRIELLKDICTIL